MLNIIVVDDEERIRQGMVALIAKAERNYHISGCFSNGIEALKHIDSFPVDVVITDIKMPRMDGLALIERLRESKPELRCIVLSGFSDFEYARNAIRFGVVDYLLKPVDKQELYNILLQVEQEAANRRKNNELLKEEAIKSILLGELEDQKIAHVVESYKMETNPQKYTVLVIKASHSSNALQIISYLKERDHAEREIVSLDNQMLALILCSDGNQGDNIKWLRKMSKSIFMDLQQQVPGYFSIGESTQLNSYLEWNRGYIEAKDACHYNFYTNGGNGGNVTTHAENAKYNLYGNEDIAIVLQKQFRSVLERMDVNGIGKCIHHIFTEIERCRLKYEEIIHLCDTILYTASKEVTGFSNEVIKKYGIRDHLMEQLKNMFTLNDLEYKLTDVINQTISAVEAGRYNSGNRTIEEVKQILEKEYHRVWELNEISERVHLNPSYLSKVFKEKTGETITEFLTSIRINKAKALLKNHMELKAYEVGEQVGYPDPVYFNKLFKKVVKLTPKEYKDSVR